MFLVSGNALYLRTVLIHVFIIQLWAIAQERRTIHTLLIILSPL